MARQNAKKQTGGDSYSRVIDIEEAQRLRRERRAAAVAGRKKAVTTREAEPESAAEVARVGNGAARRLIYLLIALVMLGLICMAGLRILDLKAEVADAERKLALNTEEKARLEKELAMLNDPTYIEAQAREHLRMIKNGETLYVFADPQEDNTR
jgi:cell division protein FtsB